MKSTFKLFGLAVAMLLPLLTQAQTPFYECTFEDDSDTIGWVLANGSFNQWYIDTAVASSGSKSLYISSDNGLSNGYNTGVESVSYAYIPIQFTAGLYLLSYDWQCMGESNYDYLRVFLVPEDATLQPDALPAGYSSTYNFTTAVPAGWVCLNGTSQLNNASTWQRKSADFIITQDTTMRLVFFWCSDDGGGSSPAAAVDSIVIDELYCPYPVHPSILNATANSFTLTWTDLAGASQWYIELDSTGQAQGSAPIIEVYDTFYTFTGLTGNTLYTLHLATDCNGDTSVWNSFSFYTPCDAITTLPYFQNFETSNAGSTTSTSFVDCWDHLNNTTTSFGYPYVYASSTASHNSGTRGLYWYSYGTTGPYKGAILPAVDTNYPVNTLQISFWVRSTSTSYVPEFVLGVVPNMLDIAGSFVPVDTVRITTGTEWTQVTVPFDSYRGPHGRLAIMAPVSASTWYAYTDEFTIDLIPECSNVSNITVERTGSASAYISWTLNGGSIGEVSGYELQYDTVGSTDFRFTDTVTSPSCLLSGLTPASDYRLRIRTLCNLDTVGNWDSIDFATGHLPCLVPSNLTDTIVYSTGTNSSSGVFVNYSWGNTFCESIYTAADLQNAGLSAGRITAITVGYNAVGSYQKEISIFMGQTSMNYFSSAAAMVDATQLTEVCHAVPRSNDNSSVGWITYNFTTPFYWDGTSNIVIAFFVNQRGGNQSSSGFYAYSTATSPTRSGASVYRYKDNSPFTVSNQTASNSGTSSYLPSISFHTSQCLQYSNCSAPLLMLSRNDLDSVIIDWGAGNTETSWDISYQADDDSVWTEISGVSDRQYVFTDLLPNTHYIVRVAPDCGGDSVFASVDFRTPCVPVTTLPLTEDFENFTAGSAIGSATTSCWNRICTYSSSYYPYLTTSYANSGTHSLYFYASSSYMSALVLPNIGIPIDSLQITFAAYKTSANYSIKVGVMSDPNDFSTFVPVSTVSPANASDWQMFEVPLSSYTGDGHYIALACPAGTTSYMYIDDITVDYIPSCPRPSNVTLRNIQANTAVVAWQGAGNDNIIEYGPYGFSHGNGMEITTMDDSTTLYGLAHSTRYQVFVRTVCDNGDTSDWSFATAFTTPCGEIDSLPFIEEFNAWGIGSSARPACWTMGGYSSYPYVINVSTADSTYRALNMYTYSSSQVYASLPPLDSTILPINTTQVIFSAVGVNSSYYSRMLVVGVCTQPGNLSTFTPVDTIRLSSIVNTYEVAFDSVTTGGKYITFVSSTERGLSSNYVYLIDVRVESIPPCQVPNRIRTVNLTATSTDIQWNDRSGSSLWQVEYGPRGFALGTGTRATVANNPYSISGLTPSTTYDVYVRSICAVGDTSQWNRAPMRFSTRQQPAPVPYFYDFETPNEWENWQTCSNVPTNWYRDTAAGSGALDASGEYAIYISADSGATVSTGVDNVVNAVAYRDFDFGSDPYHTYQISFRAKAGGTPNQGYDGLMMVHVDPNALVEASADNIQTPWGHPDSCIDRQFFIRCNGYWNTYTATYDTLTGVHRFALYWFDQNRPEFVGAPAAVDDFRITSIDCPHPAGVRAENVTISSADLSWVAPDATEYRVMVRNQAGASYALDTVVYTNHVHITGLSPATRYLIYVRRVCDSSSISVNSNAFTFMTLICNGGQESTLATYGGVTSNYLPLYTGTNYSYTQQLVLANELSGSGEISALSFRYSGSTTMTEHTNCTISMGHTTKSSFGNDFVNPDSLTIVYTGSIRSEEDWGRLIFQTPFVYNGYDNLVIAIDDNSGRHSTSYSSQHFAVDQLLAPMSVCYYGTDDIVPTNANLTNYTGNRTTFNNRNMMIVEICPPNSCPTPTLRTPLVRSNGVTLRWQNSSDRYAVSYRPLATASWIVDQAIVTENSYNITRVTPNTDYVYRVRQYCDSTGLSNWSYGYFNSSDIPCLPPENLRINNVTNSRVTLAWTPAENNLSYHLHVFNTSFDRLDTCYMSRSTVTGLEAGVTYYAAVRAECNGFDAPGEFSDTIQFTTPICPDASNLTVVDVYGNSAVLDWTPAGQETSWEILYGNRGFRIEQGISVMANDHPFTLTDLIGSTNYQAYIRTYCGDNFPGEHWIGPVTFTTLYSSIDNVSDDSRVRLQPNPTRGDVTVSLPDGNDKTLVEVLDITGRSCMSLTIPAGNAQYVLPTSKLSSGTYFLHITSNDINTVKKLVVH